MKEQVSLCALLAFVTLPTTLLAESHHIGFWKSTSVSGKSFECSLVESQAQLLNTIQEAGWDMSQGIPSPIDWAHDCAIVIAPAKYFRQGAIVFYGLEWTGSQFELKYGWQPLGSQTQTANSYSAGSVGEGQPETIVVSFKHYVHASNRLVCSNLGLQE